MQNIGEKKVSSVYKYIPSDIYANVNKVIFKHAKDLNSVSKPLPSNYKTTLTIIDENVPFDSLQSTLKGSGKLGLHGPDITGFKEKGEDAEHKVDHLVKAGYNTYTDAGIQDGGTRALLKHYTGSGYKATNTIMRNNYNEAIAKSDGSKLNITIDPYQGDVISEIHKITVMMKKGFAEVKPLKDSMWVYRGCNILTKLYPEEKLQPGNIFFDPAFQSASLASTNTFGMGNARLRIFIPKGSRVIPAVTSYTSNHPSEKEIILPAASVLRIIRFDKFEGYGDDHYYLTCIYTGHVFDEIIRSTNFEMNKLETAIDDKNTPPNMVSTFKHRQKLIKEIKGYVNGNVNEGYLQMVENRYNDKDNNSKKPEKYDPNKKFGGDMNIKAAAAIKKLIKAKKMKPKP